MAQVGLAAVLVPVLLLLLPGPDLGGVESWSLTATVFLGFYGLYGPCYLLLTRWAFSGLHGEELRAQLRRTRWRSPLARSLLVGGPRMWAVTVVLVGIAGVLSTTLSDIYGGAEWLVVVCGVLCVVGTWVLMLAVFAVEYMRLWADGAGIAFPSPDEELGFPDFVYLAVQVSTTFAGSDVTLTTSRARQLATAHSLVAFAYSTVIIAVLASVLVSGAG